MKKLGLLGKNIGYSFSMNYFNTKFSNEGITENFSYQNFDVPSLDFFLAIIENTPDLIGLNITIPYKEEVISYLDELTENAQKIGAVNVIKIDSDRKLIGHNTDYIGFINSLQPLLKSNHKKALILGTGGAAKAVAFGLKQMNIDYKFVSRIANKNTITYNDLNQKILNEFQIIINCTPLGTFPNVDDCPAIPYQYFTKNHIAYDLIYNPEKTTFLKKAEKNGAIIKNGYEMLVFQAEKAWEIWNI